MPTQITPKLLSWASDIEPNTLEQAEKTARLPIVEGHVALMPDAHLGFGATVGSVIPTQSAIIPAAVGVDIGCFAGETKVPLLNGTQATLADLTARGGEHWVYSIDAAGRIAPGKATAICTRRNAALMRVTVSGGDEIVCTPDHPFMLNDGTYREAQYLRFNDSLMPLYRRWQTRDGYESVSTGKGKSRLTHQLVYEATHGDVPKGRLVHHKNHVHFDNDPRNLEAVEIGEHSRHHRNTGNSFPNALARFQRLRREGIRRGNEDPARKAQMAEVGSRNITTYMAERPDHFAAAVARNGQRGAPVLARFNVTPRACSDCGHESPNPAALRWHKKREHGYNHKVVAVEQLTERAVVYCLQVEEHHNFALAAGVFVHNCGMIAVETDLVADGLPDSLGPLHSKIASVVPAGVGQGHGNRHEEPKALRELGRPAALTSKQVTKVAAQFGSLGSGNHFVEVSLDERDRVWVVLHSGSRGIGKELAERHIRVAKG